jgi:hypothetical protein
MPVSTVRHAPARNTAAKCEAKPRSRVFKLFCVRPAGQISFAIVLTKINSPRAVMRHGARHEYRSWSVEMSEFGVRAPKNGTLFDSRRRKCELQCMCVARSYPETDARSYLTEEVPLRDPDDKAGIQ